MSSICRHNIHVMAISTLYICPYIPTDKNYAPYQCQHLGTAAVLPTPHALPHTPVWEQCHGCCLFQSPHPCRRKVLENMACLGMRRLKDIAQHLDIRSLITYHLLPPTSKLLLNLQLQVSTNSSAFTVSKVFSNLKLRMQVSNSFRFSDDSHIQNSWTLNLKQTIICGQTCFLICNFDARTFFRLAFRQKFTS